ncbi:cysteine-rich secretory protein 1-like [Hyperolius riggenbachi]|uniref:cysteine-rich secretory protein 1-like n=1 Tax=Hyperolius riggenbachi TaxID=752182 RepID=UPI0035A3B43C
MLKMVWSTELQKAAQHWADLCYRNHSLQEQRLHNGEPCGENIVTSPECIHWTRAIQEWMDEAKFLDFGKGIIGDAAVGHYCQAMTDYTFQVGCGVSKCKTGSQEEMFYVCRYFPAGNREESLYTPYAVGEPCSMCKEYCDTSLNLCTNFCEHTDTFQNCEEVAKYRKDLCSGPDKDGCKAKCLCPNRRS